MIDSQDQTGHRKTFIFYSKYIMGSYQKVVNRCFDHHTKKEPQRNTSGHWGPKYEAGDGEGKWWHLPWFLFCFVSGHAVRLQDLGFLTRDQTHAPCNGSAESKPLDCQGSLIHDQSCFLSDPPTFPISLVLFGSKSQVLCISKKLTLNSNL